MSSGLETTISSVGGCDTGDLLKLVFLLDHEKVQISAHPKYNINAINKYIMKRISIPARDFTFYPRLIPSFDVNKSGAEGGRVTVADYDS
ncbi:hypothetical protein EV702DRAFT_172485 [Suillus placidus]|uniref:Uncharacterized protein n=1 Tax=Suillus placidus TaxID=48579 RepID=A0A9P7D3Z7_9AGAM|nr:hypothetical protein EV702DRAFT_172485 [Suillus placidus]